MARQAKGTDFTKQKIVVVGGAKISGKDYQLIKDNVEKLGYNEETGYAMSVSTYLASFLKATAADIRAGKRMKKY